MRAPTTITSSPVTVHAENYEPRRFIAIQMKIIRLSWVHFPMLFSVVLGMLNGQEFNMFFAAASTLWCPIGVMLHDSNLSFDSLPAAYSTHFLTTRITIFGTIRLLSASHTKAGRFALLSKTKDTSGIIGDSSWTGFRHISTV
jgi:hypothetical protein